MAVIRSYLVISQTSVVVEDEDSAVAYAPGSVFRAADNNPSIQRLLRVNHIVVADEGIPPTSGYIVVAGPPGATGPAGPTEGLEDTLAVFNETGPYDIIVTTGQKIEGEVDLVLAAAGTNEVIVTTNSFTRLTVSDVVSTFTTELSCPGSGPASQRFGAGTSASGAGSLAMGQLSSVSGDYGTAIGSSASVPPATYGVALGANTTLTGNSQFVVGATASNSEINLAVIGYGHTRSSSGAMASLTIRTSDRDTVVDESGQSLLLRSGAGTGNSTATSITFQTPTPTVSGSTQQSLVTRLTISDDATTFASGTNVNFTGAQVTLDPEENLILSHQVFS